MKAIHVASEEEFERLLAAPGCSLIAQLRTCVPPLRLMVRGVHSSVLGCLNRFHQPRDASWMRCCGRSREPGSVRYDR